MKHLKKFNEEYLNEALDTTELAELTINEFLEKYPDIVTSGLDSIKENPENGNRKFFTGKERKKEGNEAYFYRLYSIDGILVFDKFNNEPIALMSEYDLSNPFFFENIIILPGHDSITLFDIKTHACKLEYIR